MLEKTFYTGSLVRLCVEEPEKLAEAINRWQRDSEYWRMLSGDPAMPYSRKDIKVWVEKRQDESGQKSFWFALRTLAENRLIGDISLNGINWVHGEAWVGIGLGERDCWGKGYGTDAMRLILRYAFNELNLYRVSLEVLENNPRGLRSYEKAGFKFEGRQRQVISREGRHWDVINMSILRPEWQDRQTAAAQNGMLPGARPA